jgi:acyl phosphate:glycerol-3-phosphate acyltransferase
MRATRHRASNRVADASKSGQVETVKRTLRLITAAAGGYLLGTVPSADVVSRIATGGSTDLRSSGTGNPGGINARRVLGHRIGAAVIAADVGKGAAACGLGRRCSGDVGAHVAGAAAVAGHCYPLWFGFRGGKGVATSFGQCLYTFPAYAPIDVALALAVARVPGLRRPALACVAISSIAWLVASVAWWRRGLPNLWGPPPTAALPIANAATVLVIASRAVGVLDRRKPDELALPR